MLAALWASFLEEYAWALHGKQGVVWRQVCRELNGCVTLLRKSPLVSNRTAHLVMCQGPLALLIILKLPLGTCDISIIIRIVIDP